jgi:hypothetical protein
MPSFSSCSNINLSSIINFVKNSSNFSRFSKNYEVITGCSKGFLLQKLVIIGEIKFKTIHFKIDILR